MKYYIQKLYLLPLLGFFTASCSSSSNLQTSETDDVYFSSADKVSYVEPVYDQPVDQVLGTENAYAEDIEGRVSDPETYADSERRSNNNRYQYSYYDAPFGNPFYAYYDPFYSPGRYYSSAVMMNPWIDPWYDPYFRPGMAMAMYDPFWPRYGSGISINIGMGWGRAYNPWGYGYGGYGGYGRYNPYGYGGRTYYDNYYGVGGAVASSQIQYGPRTSRSSNVAGRNPNISRVGRNSVISPSEGRTRTGEARTSRSGRDQAGVISRPRGAAGQVNTEGSQPVRTRRSSPAQTQERQNIPTQTRTREVRTSPPVRSSGGSSTPPPTRRRRDTPSPSAQRSEVQPSQTRTVRTYEAPTRSYEPSRSSSYEPTRSSSSSSGSSSGGGTSTGRRGRN